MLMNNEIKHIAEAHGGVLPHNSFPGLYPMFYITDASEAVCTDCANDTKCDNTLVKQAVNWEDNSLHCDVCSKRIDSAYAEDEEETQKDNIKVEGHKGTWYVVDEAEYKGCKLFLLEHETYGEDAPWIAIDAQGKLVMEDITDGKDDLLERLKERDDTIDELRKGEK
jgi:hypothetical protein